MTAPEDEFWNGIWWVPDGNGRIQRFICRMRTGDTATSRPGRAVQTAIASRRFEP